jgi:TFIIF-interacting CTD phosphatase-like protein
LKEKPLSVTPIDLEDDQRARGLTHLLAVGLRILALIKHVARSQLDKAGAKLRDLYASNPKWGNEVPDNGDAAVGIQEYVPELCAKRRFILPYHRKIVGLLNLSSSIYTALASNSSKPP